MSLFVGRHENKIDKKGRVSVPKLFRSVVQQRGFQGIYVFPSFKHPALEACSEEFLIRITNSIDDHHDLFSDEQDDLTAIILESAHFLAFDPEGRIVLPPELREHAGITSEALFVGRGDRVRIWEPAAYQANHTKAFDRARASGATLKLRRPDAGEGGEAS